MTCAACVRRVERAVAAVPGVTSADVNLPLSRARIVVDPPEHRARAAAAAIREAGYEVPADRARRRRTDGCRRGSPRSIARSTRRCTGCARDATIAIVLTVPLLAIAMAHGLVTGAACRSVIVQLVLGTIVVLGPGVRYLRAAGVAVRHRSPDMNTLIALGAGAAWLSSTVVAVRWLAGRAMHMPALYFEAGAAIVAFVMIGKLLESRARAKLSDAVRGLLSLAPAIGSASRWPRRRRGGARAGRPRAREAGRARRRPTARSSRARARSTSRC